MEPKDCTKCPQLCKIRKNVVMGEGPVPCDIMYIARNPGEQEDKHGRPLIGTAGGMAMEVLSWGGFRREGVYLTNVVKCWTPKDRPPYQSEIENCREFLETEILAVRPKVIVAAGREATGFFAPYLDETYKDIAPAIMGSISDIRGIPFRVRISGFHAIVVPTFHPSYVSRTQYITKKDSKRRICNAKPIAAADILLAWRIMEHGWNDRTVRCETFCASERCTISDRETAYDLETTGLDPRRDGILGFAISDDGRSARSFDNIEKLADFVGSDTAKITQNGVFDYRFCKTKGMKIDFNPQRDFDTMFAAHTLAPDLFVNLGFINSLYVHFPPWKSKTKGKMHDTSHMDQQELHERCCYDAAATYRASVVLRKDLEKAGLLVSPYRRLYMPMVPILVDMMLKGMQFDINRCDKLIAYLWPQYKALQDKWIRMGCDIGSNKQTGEFLVRHGVDLTERTPSGKQYRVDDEILRRHSGHELVGDIRKHRALQKLLTTDLAGIRKRVHDDGAIRSDLDIALTGTGRFSSSEPDMQNVRLAIRDMYISRPGKYLYGADYKGLELIVATIMASDLELLEELKNGRDVHEEMRRFMFGAKPADGVAAKVQRRNAKTFVFGPLYGKTKYSIARELHISQADAERYLSVSCTQRPRFVEWRDLQSELAYGSGAVFSAFGRRRLLFADRVDTQAYNSPIQMTAHDITLESMILVYNELGLVPWIQVHDSIIWELPGDVHHPDTKTEQRINEILTRPIPELHNHQFQIDTGRGQNWKQIDVGVEDVEE